MTIIIKIIHKIAHLLKKCNLDHIVKLIVIVFISFIRVMA